MFRKWSMAFRLFRKRQLEPAVSAVEPLPVGPTIVADAANASDSDSAKEILELLELELGAMIRQLERAANSVAGDAEATAATLSTIRQRANALTGRTNAAQGTATTFSQAADEFTHSAQDIGSQVRDASKLADEAGAAGRGFAVVASEVKALAVQTQGATEEITKKIDALQRDAAGSVDAVLRISQAIAAIRPVFENVNGAVAEQNRTTSKISDNAASASHFIVSVGDSAAEIDGATREAEAHGESVARAGKAVTMSTQKLKARCAVLLRQGEREDRRKSLRLPCSLKIEIQTARGAIAAPVYEISLEGILIGGPDAERLPLNESLNATLESVGACRIRLGERSKAGAQARFERPDAALSEKIEDQLWALRDENIEFVTRAMEAGTALTRIFDDAVVRTAISIDEMFDADYVEIPDTNPLQHRTRILDWADRALPPFQEAFLAKDPRMAFCVMIDRNGYLPVHNKIYSHPQRPGDVVWNTANSRNRRIFNDAAGLAAGRNLRPYLIQSYARDMGNGKTVMMREIDVPIRVNGRHWGGFRTVWRPHRRD